MQFWKMNGAGNDFIVVDNREYRLSLDELSRLAAKVCERHLSLGADGLMAVEAATDGGDYRMLFFNSDGSVGEMCGNGARCICRYGYETGLAGEIQRVETTAGLVTGTRIDRRNYRVRLNEPSPLQEMLLELDGRSCPCTYVELGCPGIPHAVVEMKGLRDIPQEELLNLGRKLRHHDAFPKGANVNFYEIVGEDKIFERTYERGVEDFTYACGTGTGSVVYSLWQKGLVSGKGVRAEMTGGELVIDIDCIDGAFRGLYLTGPTNIVCKGELCDEEVFPLI